MTLSLYEIDHGGVQDWIIANSEEEAIKMLEDFMESVIYERHSYSHCQVNKVNDDMQTMTKKGILTVREIIEHYNQPYYVKAG